MHADRNGRGGLAALVFGFFVAAAVYILVAPFKCSGDGTCAGLVAFQYRPDSVGHWQAIGAGALVGGVVGLLIWLVLGSEGLGHKVARALATPLLIAGIGVSIVSQSILLLIGPIVGGLVLWLMWGSRRPSTDNSNPEPGPFLSRP